MPGQARDIRKALIADPYIELASSSSSSSSSSSVTVTVTGQEMAS
jgi:hypothetical protein